MNFLHTVNPQALGAGNLVSGPLFLFYVVGVFYIFFNTNFQPIHNCSGLPLIPALWVYGHTCGSEIFCFSLRYFTTLYRSSFLGSYKRTTPLLFDFSNDGQPMSIYVSSHASPVSKNRDDLYCLSGTLCTLARSPFPLPPSNVDYAGRLELT